MSFVETWAGRPLRLEEAINPEGDIKEPVNSLQIHKKKKHSDNGPVWS